MLIDSLCAFDICMCTQHYYCARVAMWIKRHNSLQIHTSNYVVSEGICRMHLLLLCAAARRECSRQPAGVPEQELVAASTLFT